jgi:hypothetical protein
MDLGMWSPPNDADWKKWMDGNAREGCSLFDLIVEKLAVPFQMASNSHEETIREMVDNLRRQDVVELREHQVIAQVLTPAEIVKEAKQSRAHKKKDRIRLNLPHRDGIIEKHGRVKPKIQGSGVTTAVLDSAKSFRGFLEVLLCFNAYLHKSFDLNVA